MGSAYFPGTSWLYLDKSYKVNGLKRFPWRNLEGGAGQQLLYAPPEPFVGIAKNLFQRSVSDSYHCSPFYTRSFGVSKYGQHDTT